MNGSGYGADPTHALVDLIQSWGLVSNALVAGVFDRDGRALALNAGMRRLLLGRQIGADCSELFANPPFASLWACSADPALFEGVLTFGDGKGTIRSIRGRVECRDGLLQVCGEVDVDELDQANATLVALNRSIGDLERQLIRKNRLLEHSLDRLARRQRLDGALAEINRAIRGCRTESELFRSMCAIAVCHGGFKLAGVFRPSEGGAFQLLASAGETDYLRHLIIGSDEREPTGRGPATRAYKLRQPQIVNDFHAEQATAPWHDLAKRHGIGACASLPLANQDIAFAVLNVYAEEAGYFGEEEIAILRKITEDVGFAIDAVRDRDMRRVSEARYRRIFEHAPMGLVHYDRTGTILDCNDEYVDIVGSSRERILGINLLRDLKDRRVIDAVQHSLTEGERDRSHLPIGHGGQGDRHSRLLRRYRRWPRGDRIGYRHGEGCLA